MSFLFEKIPAIGAFALVLSGTALGTFFVLETFAQERECPDMLVASQGLYRKFGDGNALFSSVSLSPKKRRAILILTREPRNEKEFFTAKRFVQNFEKMLPSGNFLFLVDDSGKILLQRELTCERKVFDLADEAEILAVRLGSVPVEYFPDDALRGKIRTELWEGNAEFPVPVAENGGAR